MRVSVTGALTVVNLACLFYLSFKTKTASTAATGEFRFFRGRIKKRNLEFDVISRF